MTTTGAASVTVPAFLISELSGRRRAVRLAGRGLPYRPLPFETVQRLEVTWYPGNPEGSGTLLGAGEEPSEIRGMWKDKYISQRISVIETDITGTEQPNETTSIALNNEPVNSVMDAVAVIDAIVREGQLIEVSWDTLVRHGYLRRFRKEWHNVHDVEWTMTFEWVSRGEIAPPPTFTRETSTSDTASTMRAQSTELSNASNQNTRPLRRDFSTAVLEQISEISSVVQQAVSLTDRRVRRALAPSNQARSMIAYTSSVNDTTEVLLDVLSAQPSYRTINTAVEPADLPLGERISAEVYVRTLMRNARRLRGTALERRTLLLQQVQKDLLAQHRAKEGEDLRDVSLRYYGTTMQWRRLLLFNLLDSTELSRDQLVLVPRITTQGQAAQP